MIKHIVMFKMNTFDSEVDLMKNMEVIKEKLLSLPDLINEIKFFEVGINESESPRAYNMVLVSEFNNYDELKTYQHHPEHVSVLKVIKGLTEKTIVVDYEK